MSKTPKKLGIFTKLILTVLPPLVLIFIISYDNIQSSNERLIDLKNIQSKINEIEYVSEIMHEIQIERDYASLFLVVGSYESQNLYQNQIQRTDFIYQIFKENIAQNESDSSLVMLLNDLNQHRSQTSMFMYSVYEVEKTYNEMVEAYLAQIALMGAGSKIPETRTEINAYNSLLRTKEYLGRTRTILNRTFVNGRFSDMTEYGLFAEYKGGFESSLQSFLKIAPPSVTEQFKKDFILTSGNMLKIIEDVFQSPQQEKFYHDPDSWWFRATSTINILHNLEITSITQIQNIIKENVSVTQREINKSFWILMLGIVLVLGLTTYLLISLKQQIRKIRKAGFEVAAGNNEITVPVETNDGIGALAKSLVIIKKNASALSEVAKKIEQGDYNIEVPLRGPKDQLGKSIDQMKTSLKEQTEELKHKVFELDQANKYKSAFLANISHELRTPLNSLLILAKVMRDSDNSNMNQDEKESLQVIIKNANDLLLLIEDILDISKIEAGEIDIQITEVDLIEVTTNIKELFTPLANEEAKSIWIDPSYKKIHLKSDPLRLGQIIKNLVSNAIKFSDPEGVVKLEFTNTDDEFIISVIDKGIGIPLEKQEAIFEAFKQVDDSISRKYGGTGLGLSISKELANRLGYRLTLSSEINKGSTFSIHIPIDQIIETSTEEYSPSEVKTDEIEVPSPPPETSVYSFLHQDVPLDASFNFYNRTLILFEPDITKVFELSGALGSFNLHIEECDDVLELKEKTQENNPIGVMINAESLDLFSTDFQDFIDSLEVEVIFYASPNETKTHFSRPIHWFNYPISITKIIDILK